MNTKTQNKLMLTASCASIGTVALLIVLKIIAFVITGSVAMLSSLFDSVQDAMTSGVNFVAVRNSLIPADDQHRFGHGKAQGIGSLIQACIIIMAALFLAKESITHLIQGQTIHDIGIGVIVSVIALIATACLVTFQTWVIKQTNSLSIRADKAHYSGDVVMNIGVLLSLLASSYWGWAWIDGVFGIVVSIYLIYSMCTIIKEALAMLMDKELPDRMRRKIKDVALSVPGVLNTSDLKTHQVGDNIFIQFAAQFDGKITLNHAHKCIDTIEEKLYRLYPGCEIIIHAEPFIQAKSRRK